MREKACEASLFQSKYKTSHAECHTSPTERSQKPGCLGDHSSEKKNKSGLVGWEAHWKAISAVMCQEIADLTLPLAPFSPAYRFLLFQGRTPANVYIIAWFKVRFKNILLKIFTLHVMRACDCHHPLKLDAYFCYHLPSPIATLSDQAIWSDLGNQSNFYYNYIQ